MKAKRNYFYHQRFFHPIVLISVYWPRLFEVLKKAKYFNQLIEFVCKKQSERRWRIYTKNQRDISINFLFDAMNAFMKNDKISCRTLALRARNTLLCDKDLYRTAEMIWMLTRK